MIKIVFLLHSKCKCFFVEFSSPQTSTEDPTTLYEVIFYYPLKDAYVNGKYHVITCIHISLLINN